AVNGPYLLLLCVTDYCTTPNILRYIKVPRFVDLFKTAIWCQFQHYFCNPCYIYQTQLWLLALYVPNYWLWDKLRQPNQSPQFYLNLECRGQTQYVYHEAMLKMP